jgi:hypothetical protein
MDRNARAQGVSNLRTASPCGLVQQSPGRILDLVVHDSWVPCVTSSQSQLCNGERLEANAWRPSTGAEGSRLWGRTACSAQSASANRAMRRVPADYQWHEHHRCPMQAVLAHHPTPWRAAAKTRHDARRSAAAVVRVTAIQHSTLGQPAPAKSTCRTWPTLAGDGNTPLYLLEQGHCGCDVIALTCALQHETKDNRSMSDLRRSSRVKDRYRAFEPGLSSC